MCATVTFAVSTGGAWSPAGAAALTQLDRQWRGNTAGFFCLYSESFAPGAAESSRLNIALVPRLTGKLRTVQVVANVDYDWRGNDAPPGGSLVAALSASGRDGPGRLLDSTSMSAAAIKTLPSMAKGSGDRLVSLTFPHAPVVVAGHKYWVSFGGSGNTNTCFGLSRTSAKGQSPQEAFQRNTATSQHFNMAADQGDVWQFADFVEPKMRHKTEVIASSFVGTSGVGYRATLKDTVTRAPVAGRTVSFTVGRTVACTGVTNRAGVASCGVALPVSLTGYIARFAGDADLLPSSGSGRLVA